MILDKLAAATRLRVANLQKTVSLAQVRSKAEDRVKQERAGTGARLVENPFLANLRRPGLNFICEVKRASPSKGLISEHFDYLGQARAYEQAGAAAISCLTEPEFFLGADHYLQEIVQTVGLPVLRKDFTISAYQIYEAKLLGASAVLLICALLTVSQLQEYLELAASLGLAALTEAHDEQEVAKALQAGAQLLGVNNRNLQDFTVDLATSLRLHKLVPEDKVFVAESGIKTGSDVARLAGQGIHNFLVGEALMRSTDIAGTLAGLQGNQDGQN